MFVDSRVIVIVCRPRTSQKNLEREGSSFMEFEACFDVGDACDVMICLMYAFSRFTMILVCI